MWLKFVVIQEANKIFYDHAILILTRNEFRPKAIKLVDKSQTLETVILFKNLAVNQPLASPLGELNRPKLQDFREVPRSKKK